jgi:putative ABC transport system ATP-binding protein
MIELQKIVKIYKPKKVETCALLDVDLKIRDGEFISVLGPSGCGKTTLLNVLGMIDRLTTGHYFFKSTDVSALPERKMAKLRKAHIGFVFQNFNLIDELNVFENVELPLVYNQVPVLERKQQVIQILEKFSLMHHQHHFPRQLSGGQQQRVAIARAVIHQPDLILADEPTGNLDSQNSRLVMETLAELHEDGATIVMVTHSTEDAMFSQRQIRMLDGQIVMEVKNKAL